VPTRAERNSTVPPLAGEEIAFGDVSGAAGSASPAASGTIALRAVAARRSVGLDWTAIDGALGYRVYWSTGPGLAAGGAELVDVDRPAFVHRALEDGVAHYYAVAALFPGGEGPLSSEVRTVPGGEWMLEELGTGLFDDIATGNDAPRVPLEKRVHVLIFAEGYTVNDLGLLHDESTHGSERGSDVDRLVDQIFALEPYSLFREAFVLWVLPRPSAERLGGDTAFDVPVLRPLERPSVDVVPPEGATAAAAWRAIDAHPFPPDEFYVNYNRRARNHVAFFLMFDPRRGRAAVSGRAVGLTDPRSGRRISAAFGVSLTHEFTHAFAQLSDEYMDRRRKLPSAFGPTWNVVASNRCDDLPWKHLLAGTEINPYVAELVGAFGHEGLGYHSELMCLMNGHHDNMEFYGGTGNLRSDHRLCNFCREMTAFRVLERTSVLPDTLTSFDVWASAFRGPFYRRFGFAVPAVVPQTNDLGDPLYQACVD
jgi:hypothetical protein